jgi:hypothetical protein
MKILIKGTGFIGDHLHQSSIAKKLKEENPGCEVDFLVTIKQPFELLCLNPYIDNVYLEIPNKSYDKIFELSPITREQFTPCEEFQMQCGIKNPSSDYKIHTNPNLDEYVRYMLSPYKDKTVIAWLSNWEERSFLFTEEEYIRGIDVPNLGYGGKRRDIRFILSELEKREDILLIEVGKPPGSDQRNFDLGTVTEYSLTASIIKNCDYFIGGEGGLANLAAGIGTKTIITGDFILQLYGWNGIVQRRKEPRTEPRYYFEGNDHITLNPYCTDTQVVEQILNTIDKNKNL